MNVISELQIVTTDWFAEKLKSRLWVVSAYSITITTRL
jgi:hypothetical protein